MQMRLPIQSNLVLTFHSDRSVLTGIPSVPEENIVSNSSVTFHKHYHPFELRRMELLLYGNFDDFAADICL